MSATAKFTKTGGLPGEVADTCKVIIVYEDVEARATGMKVCERLAEQFDDDLDFEFKWWSFRRLVDSEMAERTRAAAAKADVVIFCSHATELPADVCDWLDAWSQSGSANDGAIALVLTESANGADTVQRIVTRFEQTAQRLGMDFLQLAAPVLKPAASLAHQIESVIPQALSSNTERSHNYHWGLND